MPTVCRACQGSGMQTSTTGGVFAVTEPCRECRGRGMVVDDPCPDLPRHRTRPVRPRTMQVRIPAGVTDGQRIRIKGKGGAGENGGAAGDLYVLVHVRPHPVFGRKGDNLTAHRPGHVRRGGAGRRDRGARPCDGAAVRLRIPAGTPNGRTLPRPRPGSRRAARHDGDLLVTVEVQVPRHLSDGGDGGAAASTPRRPAAAIRARTCSGGLRA